MRLGSLELRARHEQNEIWLAGSHDGASPESPAWVRWAVTADSDLGLRRALPDRPIVVSPEQPFFLPPGAEARVFVRVPLFLQFVRTERANRRTVLDSFPSIVLSDTWWGSFTEGSLAYWLPTHARRAITEDLLEAHFVICSFLLTNQSAQPLPVDRFVVRVEHLTLFGRGNAAWSDEVRVRYEGGTEGSELQYTSKVPTEAGDVDLLEGPRETPPSGLHAITFGRLRSLSGAS